MGTAKKTSVRAGARPARSKPSCRARPSIHGMLTRSITTRIVRNRALGIQELLELVLGHLPMVDLIASRRVSKHFRDTIDTSPALQAKLFLRPQRSKTFWTLDNATEELRPYTPGKARFLGKIWIERQSTVRPSSYNPLLFVRERQDRRLPLRHRARVCEPLYLKLWPNLAYAKADSIYHRMHICQPPVKTVIFDIFFSEVLSARRHRIRRRIEATSTTGVTFGNILDSIRKSSTRQIQASTSREAMLYDNTTRTPQAYRPKIWFVGAIFVSDEEEAEVEGSWTAEKRMSPFASKLSSRKYFTNTSERRLSHSKAQWEQEDFQWSLDSGHYRETETDGINWDF